jgi:CheY-like chemotaxis protein
MPQILVLDDDLPICEVLDSVFVEEGWSVQACTRPEDALELAHRWAADAIVLDLRFPGMDAASFLAAYRQQIKATTPVILLSAASDLGEHAARLGVDGAVPKPFDLDTLCDTVRRCMAGGLATGSVPDGH